MNEAQFTRKICDELRKLGCLIFVAAGNKFGTAGWPDRGIITSDGIMYWLEFKVADGKLSNLQHYQMERIYTRNKKLAYVIRMPGVIEDYNGKQLGTFTDGKNLLEWLKNDADKMEV